MRTLMKWLVRLVLAVLLVAGAFLAYVYHAVDQRIAQTYTVQTPSIPIPTDAAAVARGQYLVEKVSMCGACHGKNLGGDTFDEPNFMMGTLYSANLTSGRGGIGAGYTNEDLTRVLLHGVKKDGHSVLFMPSQDYHFTEADAAAIIAYLRTVPPVDHETPASTIGPMARILTYLHAYPLLPAEAIDHANAHFATPPPPVDAERGRYLVDSAGCRGCHLPDLIGGGGPPPGAANITPVGIGDWKEPDFIRAIREHKRPNGSAIAEGMPRVYATMGDEELRLIFAYLKTVPAKGEKSKSQKAQLKG